MSGFYQTGVVAALPDFLDRLGEAVESGQAPS
jgi:hypothetical protein